MQRGELGFAPGSPLSFASYPRAENPTSSVGCYGSPDTAGREVTGTPYPTSGLPTLYQLLDPSKPENLMEPTGIEPVTSWLQTLLH